MAKAMPEGEKNKSSTFGNGRDVRNILNTIISNQNNRLVKTKNLFKNDKRLSEIISEDMEVIDFKQQLSRDITIKTMINDFDKMMRQKEIKTAFDKVYLLWR